MDSLPFGPYPNMEYAAQLYAAAEALAAELKRTQSDPEKLKRVCDAKNGDELREWRDVGFPAWFTVKSLKTFEPVKKQKSFEKGIGNPVVPGNPVIPGDTSGSSKATSTSADVMVKTAFGTRKAIASTPLPAGKNSVLGGGPRAEYTFDDEYRQDQKAYMKANGLKGLSASRWA
ncbi:hypothetical protein PG984_002223 [Apiospora sp. TS-2023a]